MGYLCIKRGYPTLWKDYCLRHRCKFNFMYKAAGCASIHDHRLFTSTDCCDRILCTSSVGKQYEEGFSLHRCGFDRINISRRYHWSCSGWCSGNWRVSCKTCGCSNHWYNCIDYQFGGTYYWSHGFGGGGVVLKRSSNTQELNIMFFCDKLFYTRSILLFISNFKL